MVNLSLNVKAIKRLCVTSQSRLFHCSPMQFFFSIEHIPLLKNNVTLVESVQWPRKTGTVKSHGKSDGISEITF